MPARVSLITRQGCDLCVDARVVVADVCSQQGVDWREVDVDSHPRLVERFAEEVPVVIVDDQVVGFWRIDPDRLRSALA
ncbi:glutaredoxin family protein [Demequina sp.]|uniref:glutaredoxin family protein n=1 Tax=Demequina sp. TaxID=2050685 RepID=UPI003A8706F6